MGNKIDLTIGIIFGKVKSANEMELFNNLVNSIISHFKEINYEILVVNNFPNFPFQEKINNSLKIKTISNEEEKGISFNRNLIIKNANGKYILFVDHDTIMLNNVGEKLIDCIKDKDDIIADGPKVYFDFERKIMQKNCGIKFNSPLTRLSDKLTKIFLTLGFKPSSKLIKKLTTVSYEFDSYQLCKHLTGVCMLIRKSSFDEIGSFDENYIFGFEETDWFLRAYQKGYQCIYCPDAEIIHIGGQSIVEKNIKREKSWIRSRKYYYLKFYGKAGLFLFYFVKTIDNLILEPILGIVKIIKFYQK